MVQVSDLRHSEVGDLKKVVSFTREPLYGKFSLVLLGVILISLLPHYSKIVDSAGEVSTGFIVHGVLYLGWYVLFCLQSNLASSGNKKLHKTLGYSSILFFILLMISGVEMLIGVMGSNDPYKLSLVWGIFHTIIFFSAFYLLGILGRGNLHAHKRFMLLASLSMISASVTRVAYSPIVPIDGTAVTLLSTYGLLLVPVIIDRMKFGGVHPVLKWSIPVYIVTQIIFIAIMPTTTLGKMLAFPF